MSGYRVTGAISIVGTSSVPGIMYLTNGTNSVGVSCPTDITEDYAISLPNAAGTAGQALVLASPTTTTWTTVPIAETALFSEVFKNSSTGNYSEAIQNSLNMTLGVGWSMRKFTFSNLEMCSKSLIGRLRGGILLQPGTYFIEVRAPLHDCVTHRARLYDVTHEKYVEGSCGTTEIGGVPSIISTTVTVDETSLIVVQHRSSSPSATLVPSSSMTDLLPPDYSPEELISMTAKVTFIK